jgi:hypothetical protein
MGAAVTLATTHHDPNDAMLAQAQRILPRLQELYSTIVITVTPVTSQRTITQLRELGVEIEIETEQAQTGLQNIGLVRQKVVGRAIEYGARWVHLCDWDRILHWAEFYPDELAEVVAAIPNYDLLILGRTPRAFATHPRVQRDTEAIINHTFGLAWGQPLDVTAASRGLSRRAVQRLMELEASEATVGNDCAWPLYLAQDAELVVGYAATEGLEWETPDRHGDEIAAAGGLDAWIANYDADPAHWEFRMRLALYEVEAVNRWRSDGRFTSE